MTPTAFLLIVQGIQAAIAAAPEIASIMTAAKDFVSSLFGAGVITAAQQDALHAHIDDLVFALLNGNEPPEFTIEPDPIS